MRTNVNERKMDYRKLSVLVIKVGIAIAVVFGIIFGLLMIFYDPMMMLYLVGVEIMAIIIILVGLNIRIIHYIGSKMNKL